jgi:hypothetical protein
MVEGSLGGGIIIKTHRGLDFKEPFVSVRVAGTTSNLNKNWDWRRAAPCCTCRARPTRTGHRRRRRPVP